MSDMSVGVPDGLNSKVTDTLSTASETGLPVDPAEPAAVLTRQTPRHLPYLDGLRGLASLYVLLGHMYIFVNFAWLPHVSSHALVVALRVFNVGQTGVDVFIVLSGYCLMIPVVTSLDHNLRGGMKRYILRRAKRILPAYYFAIVFSLLLSLAAAMATHDFAEWKAQTLPEFSPGSLITHILLIHNLFSSYIHTIDAPMWSVATEWQLYFLFPLFLLPVWKRMGGAASIAVGFGMALLIHIVFNKALDQMCPWYIGLFAFGMVGAGVNFSESSAMEKVRTQIPWGLICGISWFGILGYCSTHQGWYLAHHWIADTIIGFAAMTLLISLSNQILHQRQNGLCRLLESRWAVTLGAFSYSTYLIHYQLLTALYTLLSHMALPSSIQFVVQLGVLLPLTLGICYLYYSVCERPFMAKHS